MKTQSFTSRPLVHAYESAGVPVDRIRDFQRNDAELVDLISYIETQQLPANQNKARSFLLQGEKFYLDDNGLLLSLWTPRRRRPQAVYPQLVIPEELKHEILAWAHDDITAGHLGPQKTYAKIRTRYY